MRGGKELGELSEESAKSRAETVQPERCRSLRCVGAFVRSKIVFNFCRFAGVSWCDVCPSSPYRTRPGARIQISNAAVTPVPG